MVLEALYSWNYDQVQWLPADPDGQHQDEVRIERAADGFQAGE